MVLSWWIIVWIALKTQRFLPSSSCICHVFFFAAHHKLIYLHLPGNGVATAAVHGLQHLVNKIPGRGAADLVPARNLRGTEPTGGSTHFKGDHKDLAQAKLAFVEKGARRDCFHAFAKGAGPGVVGLYRGYLVVALGAYKPVFPFEPGQVFLAGKLVRETFSNT